MLLLTVVLLQISKKKQLTANLNNFLRSRPNLISPIFQQISASFGETKMIFSEFGQIMRNFAEFPTNLANFSKFCSQVHGFCISPAASIYILASVYRCSTVAIVIHVPRYLKSNHTYSPLFY